LEIQVDQVWLNINQKLGRKGWAYKLKLNEARPLATHARSYTSFQYPTITLVILLLYFSCDVRYVCA